MKKENREKWNQRITSGTFPRSEHLFANKKDQVPSTYIDSFDKYLPSAYHLPDTVLGSRDTAVNRQNPCPHEAYILEG